MASDKGWKTWQDIGSDVSWDDYGGKWAKRARDGSWYVVEFTNMYDACGEDECKRDGQNQYCAEVHRVDLTDLSPEKIKSALDCVGLTMRSNGAIWDSQGIEYATSYDDPKREIVIVEACVSYGAKQPIDSFSSNRGPIKLRNEARRSAESYMRDAVALESRLDRPVNRIGSTAREYARGDINAALFRGPIDQTKAIILKMHGATDAEIETMRECATNGDEG